MLQLTRTPIVLLGIGILLLGGCDEVRVINAAGDVGILVDGQRNDPANDDGYVDSGSGTVEFDVGYLEEATTAGDHNWVIGFGTGLAPTHMDTLWTTDKDNFDMTLGDTIEVSLAIWIMKGPYDDQVVHAAEAVATTVMIWAAERTGLEIGSVDYYDATADPDNTFFLRNSIGDWDDYSDLIGYDGDRINIYWINTVGGSLTAGVSDFGNRIRMGKNTGDELLVHEIGHALSLQHPTALPDFDNTNVMWDSSNVREFLTEGQIFRSHFDDESTINAIFAARPASQPTPACPDLSGNTVCPTIERRLWGDGAFPAN